MSFFGFSERKNKYNSALDQIKTFKTDLLEKLLSPREDYELRKKAIVIGKNEIIKLRNASNENDVLNEEEKFLQSEIEEIETHIKTIQNKDDLEQKANAIIYIFGCHQGIMVAYSEFY
jgi:hypothetical protein